MEIRAIEINHSNFICSNIHTITARSKRDYALHAHNIQTSPRLCQQTRVAKLETKGNSNPYFARE